MPTLKDAVTGETYRMHICYECDPDQYPDQYPDIVSSPTENHFTITGVCYLYSVFGSIRYLGNSKRGRNKNEYDYEVHSNYNEVKSGKSQLCRDIPIQHLMYCQY